MNKIFHKSRPSCYREHVKRFSCLTSFDFQDKHAIKLRHLRFYFKCYKQLSVLIEAYIYVRNCSCNLCLLSDLLDHTIHQLYV